MLICRNRIQNDSKNILKFENQLKEWQKKYMYGTFEEMYNPTNLRGQL